MLRRGGGVTWAGTLHQIAPKGEPSRGGLRRCLWVAVRCVEQLRLPPMLAVGRRVEATQHGFDGLDPELLACGIASLREAIGEEEQPAAGLEEGGAALFHCRVAPVE